MIHRLLTTLCVAAAFAWTAAGAQEMKDRPEAWIDLEGIWPDGIVHICWENPENYTQETAWVEDAAIQHIEGINREISSIRFIGKDNQRWPWAKCTDSFIGIRIRIADEWPRSDVGAQWLRDNSGRKIDQGGGTYKQLPTHTVLNFTFSPPFSCAPREHCIKAIAVHELLHALGFLHEQLRPDAPQWCKDRYAGHRDNHGLKPVAGTANYDQDSHMNYCDNMYRMPIRLSKGDVEALQNYYRPK